MATAVAAVVMPATTAVAGRKRTGVDRTFEIHHILARGNLIKDSTNLGRSVWISADNPNHLQPCTCHGGYTHCADGMH